MYKKDTLDTKVIDMFNGDKAIAVRIYENINDSIAEFLFLDGSFVNINLSNYGYRCFAALTSCKTLFYDERIDINKPTAYSDALNFSSSDRIIEIEYNDDESSINIYEYKQTIPGIIRRVNGYYNLDDTDGNNILHALINQDGYDHIYDILSDHDNVYIVDLRILNKPKFEDLIKKDIMKK